MKYRTCNVFSNLQSKLELWKNSEHTDVWTITDPSNYD